MSDISSSETDDDPLPPARKSRSKTMSQKYLESQNEIESIDMSSELNITSIIFIGYNDNMVGSILCFG